MNKTKFSDLNLNSSLLNVLSDIRFEYPTPIQERAFSTMMSGRDVVGIAQTGTGKTIAYLLPCLRMWKFSKIKTPQVLIVVPTRELVVQVIAEIEKLTDYMNVKALGVYGGANIKTQRVEVLEGCDFLVATPGRLMDLILDGTLKTKSIKKLVIDEVDEMLNLGFRHQLEKILDLLPEKRQNLLFSATLSPEVDAIIDVFFKSPIRIEAAPAGTPIEKINQLAYLVPNVNTAKNLLVYLLNDNEFEKVLVFSKSRKTADDLFELLNEKYPEEVAVIHSNKAQNTRFKAVEDFSKGLSRILISTDLLSRGIDISEVSHVINYDLPDTPESYIHRIGRTGRAEKTGIAITFIKPPDEEMLNQIEDLMKVKLSRLNIPEKVDISELLTPDEMPKISMPGIKAKPIKYEPGPAFHEKKDKNKKVNVRKTRAQQMREKYGKPRRKS